MTEAPASERDVVVVGAGVAGLGAAIALAPKGFRVTLLERDPAPGPGAELDWQRRGVPHARQPHFFMGRVRELLREHHPGLLERLREAGVGERRFEEYLHPANRDRYAPGPGDERLTALAVRRAAFERILRRHVEEERLATLVPNANVVRLLLDPSTGPPPSVRGVAAEVDGETRSFGAGVVIDASGRTGRIHRLLEETGARFREERHDCRLLYFTRWYRLRPGCDFPPTAGLPAQIYADFVAGALPADNGHFTITIQVHEGDDRLVEVVRDAARFQRLCEALPAIAPWVSSERSEPQGDVVGFGMMDAFWRSMVVGGEPQVHGAFFLGDTAVRSNPKFGRGCTWALLAAHLLADVLAGTTDPRERVLRYERALERELRDDWRTMLAGDRSARRQFEIAAGRRRPTLADRATTMLERWVNEALIADPEVFRTIWTEYHGLERMASWMRRPAAWSRLLGGVLRGAGDLDSEIARIRRRPSREAIFAMEGATG